MDGLDWYPRAFRWCETQEETYGRWGVTAHKAAAVLAVLSPLISWARNVQAAETIIGWYVGGTRHAHGHGVLPRNEEKAWRILCGEPPQRVVAGQKVTNFWLNVSGFTENVTVDRHAMNVAYGCDLDRRTQNRIYRSIRAYHEVADAYRQAAARVRIEPCEMQAICWLVRRKELDAWNGIRLDADLPW